MRSTIAARDLFALAESHPTPCHPVSHNIQNSTNIGMSVNRQMWEKVNNIMVVGPIRNDDICIYRKKYGRGSRKRVMGVQWALSQVFIHSSALCHIHLLYLICIQANFSIRTHVRGPSKDKIGQSWDFVPTRGGGSDRRPSF